MSGSDRPTIITEYDRGVLDERERILALIRDSLRSWGHRGAPGCVCCTTAEMIVRNIRETAS